MKEVIIKCDNCGADNLSTSKNCLNCGAELELPNLNKKEKFNINKENILMILRLLIGIISLILYVISSINTFKLVSDGLPVIGGESGQIFGMCIIECLVPLPYLIAGILCILKRNSDKKFDIILLMILYLVNSALSLIPLLTISDILYMVIGINKISLLLICAVANAEFALFWLYSLLDNIFDKRNVKIILTVIFIILAIILCIMLINGLSPSEYLLPDY